MVKVRGIGGVFFRSKDPKALSDWYKTHLGIDPAPTDEKMLPWMTDAGVTVFSLNFRVDNLDTALEELNAAGIESSDIMSMEGVGRFARIHDPEGNPIELWEPA